jgi:hypothetical protein
MPPVKQEHPIDDLFPPTEQEKSCARCSVADAYFKTDPIREGPL